MSEMKEEAYVAMNPRVASMLKAVEEGVEWVDTYQEPAAKSATASSGMSQEAPSWIPDFEGAPMNKAIGRQLEAVANWEKVSTDATSVQSLLADMDNAAPAAAVAAVGAAAAPAVISYVEAQPIEAMNPRIASMLKAVEEGAEWVDTYQEPAAKSATASSGMSPEAPSWIPDFEGAPMNKAVGKQLEAVANWEKISSDAPSIGDLLADMKPEDASVAAPVVAEPVAAAEPTPEPEPVYEEPVAEPEPEPAYEEPVAEPEPEPAYEEPVAEPEPEPAYEELVAEEVYEEPVAAAEPEATSYVIPTIHWDSEEMKKQAEAIVKLSPNFEIVKKICANKSVSFPEDELRAIFDAVRGAK